MPLSGGQFRDNSVGAAKIADGAVGTSKIADDAVTGAKVASDTLTAADIAPDVVGNVWSDPPIVALATTGSGQAMTATGLSAKPVGGNVTLTINGLADYEIGDGVKTKDVYFSADGGTTARSLASIDAGDIPYSGSRSGSYTQSLTTSDVIVFSFSKSI